MELDLGPEVKDARAEFAALERQKKRRDAEPLLLCKLITRWPVRAFCKSYNFLIIQKREINRK